MTTVLYLLAISIIQAIALQNIPGTPGVDYPVYARVPRTRFFCQKEGYFADVEAGCQVFHVCQRDGRMSSFLCPNGTIFHQPYSVCIWWYEAECSSPAGTLVADNVLSSEDTAQRESSYGLRTNSLNDISSERSRSRAKTPPDTSRRSEAIRKNFLEDLNDDDDYEDEEPGEIMIAQSRKRIPPYKLQQYYFNSIAGRSNRDIKRHVTKSASARRMRSKN